MRDVERDLAALAAELEWPPEPDLAGPAVRWLAAAGHDEARHPGARRHPSWARRRRVATVLIGALLAVPATAVAVPGVLEWLGLRHVTVERRATPPPARDHALGERMALATAARRAGLTPLVPPQLDGAAAYERDGRLSLTRDGLLLEQRRGTLDELLLRKIVGIGAGVRRVRVDGRPGLWLPTPHAYLWTDPSGAIREQRPIRSGPALVWERGGRVLRLEGDDLTLARALAVARAAR